MYQYWNKKLRCYGTALSHLRLQGATADGLFPQSRGGGPFFLTRFTVGYCCCCCLPLLSGSLCAKRGRLDEVQRLQQAVPYINPASNGQSMGKKNSEERRLTESNQSRNTMPLQFVLLYTPQIQKDRVRAVGEWQVRYVQARSASQHHTFASSHHQLMRKYDCKKRVAKRDTVFFHN